MATSSLLTVLSSVPWGQVIDAAPKVAEAATRLWHAATRKKSDAGTGDAAQDQAAATPAQQLAALQGQVEELRTEMQAASELIKALAEQNAQLVQRVEANRQRLLRLSLLALAAGAGLLGGLLYLLLRG